MKKYVFIAVAILISIISAQAQIDVFTNGEYVGYDINEKKNEIIIHKIDSNNITLFSKVVPVFERYKLKSGYYGEFHFKELRKFGSKYYLLYRCYDYKTKQKEVIACKVNNNLKVDSPMLIWTHLRAKLSASEFEEPYFFKSENGATDGYYFSHNLFGDDKEMISLVNYDEDLNKIWENTYVLPVLDRDARMKSMQITDDGTTMIGTLEMKEPQERNSSIHERDKRHFIFTKEGFNELEFSPKANIKIWDWKVQLTGKGKVLMAGAYLDSADAKTVYTITGIVSAYYNVDKKDFEEIHYHKLSTGFEKKLEGITDADRKTVRIEYTVPGLYINEQENIEVMVNRNYYVMKYVGAVTTGAPAYSESRETGGSFNLILNPSMTEMKLADSFVNPLGK